MAALGPGLGGVTFVAGAALGVYVSPLALAPALLMVAGAAVAGATMASLRYLLPKPVGPSLAAPLARWALTSGWRATYGREEERAVRARLHGVLADLDRLTVLSMLVREETPLYREAHGARLLIAELGMVGRPRMIAALRDPPGATTPVITEEGDLTPERCDQLARALAAPVNPQ